MTISWYALNHLDRQFILTGSYDSGADETTWTLPVTDNTVDTIILGPDFQEAGDIVGPDSVSGNTVKKDGDWSDGEVAIGRAYTMSIELTRPYIQDRNGNADTDAWVQIRQVVATFHNTGALTIRTSMLNRNDRKREMDVDPIDARGQLTAWHNGNAFEARTFIESYSPKPCTVIGVEFTVDYAPRRG